MAKNALIYCRVSTEEQAREGFSLDAQEKFCRNFALQNDIRIIDVYREEGKSGTKLDRPALTELLDRCQQDDRVDIVLVQETDRLARNTKDHLTIKALLKKANVTLISVAQPMLDDSPEGNMIDTILASVNQFQSDINGRKVKKGLQERLDEGWWPGWAPLGYVNISIEGSENGKKSKRIVKEDVEQWHILRHGFRLYLTGNYSVDEIGDLLYKKGLRSKSGKKVSHNILTHTIKNPFYAGMMRYNGKERLGKHKPMITPAEHRRILSIMSSHNLHACRRRRHSFILRGFVFCNICGQRYTAETHKFKNKQYYHCASMRKHTNKGQNVEVAKLEQLVEDYFKKIEFSQEFVTSVTAKIKDLYQHQTNRIGNQKQALFNQRTALEKKRDFAETKLLDGVLSDDDFSRIRAKLTAELGQVQEQLDDLEAQRECDMEGIKEVCKLTRTVYTAYRTASPDLKRQYLGLFWEKFLVQDRQIVEAIPTRCVRVLLKKQKVIISANWRSSRSLIITLENLLADWQYWAKISEKLDAIKAYEKSIN
ncbi:hypothetical protein DCC62_00460 [candidate division KSB1 bacterium]|nr:MAG: hypothetical protein DCC62_00460 [candidate division KSB1 bacterium]